MARRSSTSSSEAAPAAPGGVVHAGTPSEQDALVHPLVFDGTRPPWAALLALLLVVAIEGATCRAREALYDDVFFLADRKLARLRDGGATGRGDDVVILGDSMFLSARPDRVAQALGLDPAAASNYTWPFFGMEGYPYMLRGYLAHNPPPRVVVANLMPLYFALPHAHLVIDGHAFSRARAYAVLPTGPYLRALAEEGAWRLFGATVKALLRPPTMTWRDGWRRVMAAWARGEAWPERPYKERRWEEEYERTGAYLLFDREVAPPDPVGRFEREVPLRPTLDPEVMRRFEEMVRMAGEAGSVVVVMNPPVSASMAAHLEATGVAAAFRAAMDDLAARHDHVALVEPLLEAAPDAHFADISHLNRAGDAAWQAAYPARLAARSGEVAGRLGRMRGE